MYMAEITGRMDNARSVKVDKEFARKGNAVKAAQKALKDGVIYFDNPELYKWQRRVEVESARVYNEDNPEEFIEIAIIN